MLVTGGNRSGSEGCAVGSGAEANSVQGVTHLTRLVAQILGVARSEPAIPAASPAFDLTAVQQRTRVVVAGGNRSGSEGCAVGSGAEANSVQGVTHLTRLVAQILGVARSEPASVAGSPAFDLTAVQQRTRVVLAGGNRSGSERCAVGSGVVTGPVRHQIRLSVRGDLRLDLANG